MADVLDGFAKSTFSFDGKTKDVYRGGSGPGIIVISEIPGITPGVAHFARRLIDAGFAVAMPVLFGVPGRKASVPYIMRSLTSACVSREFATWALNRTSPVI